MCILLRRLCKVHPVPAIIGESFLGRWQCEQNYRGVDTSCGGCRWGLVSGWEGEWVMEFPVLPPEINSVLMYSGAGSSPLLARARGGTGLEELGSAAVSFGPDVWTAFAGSLPTATAVLGRWPDIRLLAGAPTRHVDRRHRRAHPRCRRHPGPAEAIKTAATGWAAFWDGHLDLDALAVDVTEHLSDLTDDRCARW